jgi:acyl-CoA synthetase (AMP-forming)/AMP-acid ligase II
VRIEDLLIRNAANLPQRTALVDSRRHIDYDGLLGESLSLAAALQRRDLRPGARVAVISANRIELIVAAFACFHAGLVFQPVNFRLSAGDLTRVLDDAAPDGLLVDEAAFPHHAELARRRPGLRALIAVGAKPAEYAFSDGDGDGKLPDPGLFRRPSDPGRRAALLYTGGTTGAPKGTVISHHAWIHSCRDGAWALRLTRGDVSYMCVPLFHVSFVHFLSTFYLGVPTILAERVRPTEIVDAIARRSVTHTTLVQATLVDLLADLEENPRALPRLTTLQYGGSPIAPAVIERVRAVFGDVLHQNYGSTEAGGAVTCLLPEDHDPRLAGNRWRARVRSAGCAMPGAEVGIFDAGGQRLGPDEQGDVRVRSEAVMDGYWRNEAATREVLLEDGWLDTGDVGRLDADGYLYIVDRKKDMIISGGENIYARDVEDILLAHPDVREAAVVGGPNPRLGEEVVAYVVSREGSHLTEASLLAWVAERLAGYKKPAKILFEASLPRTPVGKVHKPTLRQRIAQSGSR